jgi:hypothetical protein
VRPLCRSATILTGHKIRAGDVDAPWLQPANGYKIQDMRGTRELPLLLLVVACGSSAPSDPTMVPLGSWDREWAAVNCARIFACCDAAEQKSSLWNVANEADCRKKILQAGGSKPRDVAAGFVVYDPQAARRCIDELAVLPCATLFNHANLRTTAPSCNVVTPGARKLGEYCQGLDMYCESGNCVMPDDVCGPPLACPTSCGAGFYCDEAAGCMALEPAGSPCATGVECVSMRCEANVCAAGGPDGASCLSDGECASGACSRIPGGSATCGPPLPDGATCYTDSGCASGTCVVRSNNGIPTCGGAFCDGV